jgi:hypothetical protein
MAIATQWRIQDDFKKIFAVWQQAVAHSAGLVQQTVQIAAARDLTLIVRRPLRSMCYSMCHQFSTAGWFSRAHLYLIRMLGW